MTRRSLVTTASLAVVLTAWLAGPAGATPPPGTLDPSFGSGGKAFVDFSGHPEWAWQDKLQPDGKVILVGEQFLGSGDYRWAVARLTPDGHPDTTFSGDGKVITNFDGQDDEAWDAAVLSSGKILVIGYAGPQSSSQVAVARYKPNGALDPTFGGGDGKVVTTFPGVNRAYGLRILGDGRFLVMGDADANFAAYAFKPGGGVDHSFGSGGREVVDFGVESYARRATVLSNGKILVTGHLAGTGGYDIPVVRLMPDGTPDPTFIGDGKATYDINGGEDEAWGIFGLKGGKILVAGYAGESGGRTTSNTDFLLMRLLKGGKPDTTFSGDGKATFHAPGTAQDYAFGVIRQPDRKVVLAGGVYIGGVESAAVMRFLPNGQPDTGFGTGGVATTPIGSEDSELWGVARDKSGRLVVGGWAGDTNPEFLAARYFG